MRGVTLIELVVVAGIIAVLSAVLIVGHATFSKTLLLANTASDVALSFRNAEVYGIGSRATGAVSNAGYGLDFSTGSATTYTFFADTDPLPGGVGSCHPLPVNGASAPNAIPGNCYYTAGDNPPIQTFTLNNGMQIKHFCAYLPTGGGVWYCNAGGGVAIQHLSIVFARPNTSATFGVGAIGAGFTSVAGISFTKACISIESPQATNRSVLVNQVGEIVATQSCP